MNNIKTITGLAGVVLASLSFSAQATCTNGSSEDSTISEINSILSGADGQTEFDNEGPVGHVCGHTVQASFTASSNLFSFLVDGDAVYTGPPFSATENDFATVYSALEFVSGTEGTISDSHSDENELQELTAQSRQITRFTANTIAQRLSANVSKVFSGAKFQNTMGGSSDAATDSLAFWGTTNFSQITEDDGRKTHRDTDIYQFMGGIDKSIGNVFFGSALTYAYSENEQAGLDSYSNTVGVTPYIAYKLTDFMYVSALAGYNYTGVIGSGADTDIHEYYTEADLALFKQINSITLKARAGVRYNHSIASIKGGADNSADELIWIGDAEVGYRFANGLTTYTGVLFEHYDREASGTGAAATAYHEGVFYMRWGADYPIADKVTIGANIETDLNDHDSSLVSGGVNIRMEM